MTTTACSRRALFIHHNLWKIDFYHIGNDRSPIHLRDEEGRLTRVWGEQGDLFRRAGYGIEEMMFSTLIDAKCNVVEPPEGCPGLLSYYNTIFRSKTR